MRVPWTARRSNQSILKEISPGIFLETGIEMNHNQKKKKKRERTVFISDNVNMLRHFLKVKTITKVKTLMSDEVNKRNKDTSKAKQISK